MSFCFIRTHKNRCGILQTSTRTNKTFIRTYGRIFFMKKLFLLVVILNIVSVGNIVADDEVVHRIKVRDIAKDFSLLKDIKKGDFIVAFTGKPDPEDVLNEKWPVPKNKFYKKIYKQVKRPDWLTKNWKINSIH